jgi:hypothetical protein
MESKLERSESAVAHFDKEVNEQGSEEAFNPQLEELLDQALSYTFPASDPIAIANVRTAE